MYAIEITGNMYLQVDNGWSVHLFFVRYDSFHFHTGQEHGDICCLHHGWPSGVKFNDYFYYMQNFLKYFIDLCDIEFWCDFLLDILHPD